MAGLSFQSGTMSIQARLEVKVRFQVSEHFLIFFTLAVRGTQYVNGQKYFQMVCGMVRIVI